MFTLGKIIGTAAGMTLRLLYRLNRFAERKALEITEGNAVREAEIYLLREDRERLRRERNEMLGRSPKT